MRIVVLDGYGLNPGDLSWRGFEELGPVTIYDRSGPHEVVPRAGGAEVILTNKTPVPGEAIRSLPDLRYVGVLATGYNVVDVEAAAHAGVAVSNVPTYSTESVAQMVFALLLELARHSGHHSSEVLRGRWSGSPDFCFWDFPQVELSGKTMGIVGFGRIGRATARVAHAFGMRVLAHSRTRRDPPPYPGFRWCALEELLTESDVVSLHCPLLPETENLIDRPRLALMKPTAYLINTSRGQLVVEDELASALSEGTLAGAGLDVLRSEPPAAESPLYSAPNIIITPHIAWATKEARTRLMDTAIENLREFLRGKPRNLVTPR